MNAGRTDIPSVTVSTTKIETTVQATRPVWAMVTPGGYHIHQPLNSLGLSNHQLADPRATGHDAGPFERMAYSTQVD
jgi:hypothetical protein